MAEREFPRKCPQCRQKTVSLATSPSLARFEHDGRKYEFTIDALSAPRSTRTPIALSVAAGAIAVFGFAAAPAFADVKDYEFQLVQTEAKKGDATIDVRLRNKKTGKAVSDAVIIAKRIDMAPDGMAEMATKIDQMPSVEPGVYRFKANLSMEGRWQLSLGAKVQGETGTVETKLVVTAQQ